MMTSSNIGIIYYLIPDLYNRKIVLIDLLIALKRGRPLAYIKDRLATVHRPVGGTKVSYQHCLLLKDLGYEVYPLIMGNYIGNFFGYDLELKYLKETGFKLKPNDIVVGQEFLPYDALKFKNAKRILFMQNWINIGEKLKRFDRGKTYLELGYDHVITCGDYCSQKVHEMMNIPAATITNGIDRNLFFPMPERRIEGRVLALSRKNLKDLNKIKELLKDENIDFHVVDRLTQSELIEEYRRADIFLAMGYPEGFSLPPLEAMNCGCAVAGFTGGGANEFMIDNDTALVAADGDCETAARKLLDLIQNKSLKERIRVNGMEKAKIYSLANTKQKLADYYGSLF